MKNCFISAVLLPMKTSKAVTRARKFETRNTKSKTVKFKVPPIVQVLSGEWLSDLHIKAASDLSKIQFPDQNGLLDPKLSEDLSFPVTEIPFVQILHAGNHWITSFFMSCEDV